MSAETRLVIASNRLPFTVESDSHELKLQPTSGGLAAALASVHSHGENVWIGWPGDCSGLDERQRAELSSELRRTRVVPVDLSGSELVEYYDGVCNSVLWPVLHYLIDRLPLTLPEFRAYRAVNERFAEAVASTYREDDVIWIHDYHLLLAPAMVRARIPGARIGFFLHTPFPAADVFRVLPWRRELLDGMLGATLVGLQTRGDAANFAAAIRMFTEYRVDDAAVIADEREIRFGAYPIGVDPTRLDAIEEAPGSEAAYEVLRPVPEGTQLLVGVDRLDYTKGIPRRLAAFEQLLADEPHLRGHVELLQVAVPSRGHVPSYVSFKQEVDEHVARINDRFGTPGWTPVRYALQSVGLAELRAIYRAADVMLVTALRDGMNLVAKEFVSSRTDEDGVLILSEMAGASEDLTEALLVNPYSVEELAASMSTALTIDREERRRRMRALRERIGERTVDRWVERFVTDLAAAGAPATPAGWQLAEVIRSAIFEERPLSLALIYEEALIDRAGPSAPLNPDPELLELLRELATRSNLDLHVISGLDHDILDRWFDMVPVTLWADHGLWRREHDGRRWQRTQWVDTNWTGDVRKFLDQFTARSPGTFVEERPTGLAWHFGRAARVQGRAHAQTLYALLRDAADAMGFSVILEGSLIELRPAGLSTAHTIRKLLQRDAAAGRAVVFEGSDRGTAVRDALRPSDILVRVGAAHAPGAPALDDIRAVRDVLKTVVGWLPPARRRAPALATRIRNAAAAIAGAASPVGRSPIAVRIE
jgi:trehalose 6-phosphate synthase/phosphatase